jgi:predicted Zn-dependent peptidase
MSATSEATQGIESTTLANGVRIITEPMSHVRSVSVGVWIGTGSRREQSQETGISHFIEHMLFKGTTSRSAEEIASSVDSIGGNLDAFTAKELVSFNTKVLDEHLPVAFDILSDLVLNPLFQAEDVEKEKGVVLEEQKMEEDNPEYLVHELFSANFWKDHPLGRPILGTKESIARFNRDSVLDYYRRYYVPSNMTITAAGNLTHARLVELVRERFEGLRPAPFQNTEPAPVTHARLTVRDKKSLEQVQMCLGVPSFCITHQDRYAVYVLNALLGGGMSSRLFQNIREKLGLAYAVFSELNLYSDTGCLAVYAGTSVATARQVVECTMKEFRALKDEIVPPEEVRRSKDHLKGSLMLSLESTSSRMANLARQELYFHRFFSLDEMVEGVERVTAEDLQRLARQLFDSRRIGLTVLGSLNGFKIERHELAC